MVLQVLRETLEQKAPGPQASFTLVHLVYALLVLGSRGTIGRKGMAVELGVGAGAVRTIIEKLKGRGLLKVGRRGCSLSKGGTKLFNSLMGALAGPLLIGESSLSTGKFSYAVVVRGSAGVVRLGIEQRDEAIRAGASGASTLLFRDSRFQIPGGSDDCERDFPEAVWSELRRYFELKGDDVVIVSGGDKKAAARDGALAAALTLLRL